MKIIGSDKGLRSPEFHMKKEKERKVRLTLGSVLAILILVSPIIILRSQRFLIKSITIAGNTVTKSEDIESLVATKLTGNYGLIVPHSSSIFYPKAAIQADLLLAIPRLKSVTITRTGWKGISITVTERTPAALYCTNVTTAAPTGCYFMDQDGFIFSEAPSFSGGVYVAYTSESPLESPLGHYFLDSATFAKLVAMLNDLNLLHMTPKILIVKSDDSYNLTLSSGLVVIWKQEDDAKSVESNLISFTNDASIFDSTHTLADLSYIDLRFGNKVFYKFKNE